MQLSAAFCRAQQAIHSDRASNAQLDNVRRIAGKAAAAWAIEAQQADSREARRERARLTGAVTDVTGNGTGDAFDDEDHAMFRANPDRDLADD